MKKFGKFVFGTLSLATVAAGAYFVYKKFIKNDDSDDFNDFEDDFDDFDTEEVEGEFGESREYVSIQIDQEDSKEDVLDNEPETIDTVLDDNSNSTQDDA